MAYQRLIRGIHASSSSILPLIFIECIDYGEDDPGPLITKVNDGPWALSRVSHAWLTISLQTPQIWAKIRIGGPEDDFNDIMPFDPVSLLRLALVRSRKAPLSVKLEFSRDPGFDYNGAALMRNVPRRASMICRNLIRVMAAYSARWQKAQLALTGSFIPLLDPIRARLPLLRILSVHNNGDEDPKQEFTFISEAPLLREVTLLNMPFQNVTLPWSQITYLEDIRLDAPPIPLKDVPDKTAAYVNLLRANPQLEDLNVASGSFGTGFGKPIRPRVVHNLPKLRATSPRFLQALILPMLTEFSTVGPEPGTYAAILDLIKRSKCDINTLSLADFQPQTEIFEILRLTPHLKHLSLRFSGWQKMYDTAMEMLVKRLTAERDFLPHLEALDVYISPLPPTCYADSEREGIYRMKQPDTSDYPIKVQFMNDAFFKMVEGRWDKIGKGSMYSIFFLAELPTRLVRLSRASVAKIGRMCDRGLDVEINAEDPYGKGEMISYVYQSSCQSNTFCPLYHPRR